MRTRHEQGFAGVAAAKTAVVEVQEERESGQGTGVQSDKETVQGVRRDEHLPAQSAEAPVQSLRRDRDKHLPAQSDKEPVQGVRRGEHLQSVKI